MGYGEVIPNGSVHWAVVHQDIYGKAKPRAALGPSTTADSRDVVALEGSYVRGVDSIPHDQIGRWNDEQGRPKGHGGKLRVSLRFETSELAVAAIADALKTITEEPSGLYVMVVDVPAVKRSDDEAAAPPPSPLAAVRVDW